jgi:AraC-like DNA-binding protein
MCKFAQKHTEKRLFFCFYLFFSYLCNENETYFMEHIQFTAIVLMVLLTLKLLMLPKRAVSNWAASRSRGVMTVGMVLLLLQFALQYALKLRAMGVTQAVMLNLFFFIPASWMFSLSVLYLQRRGHITLLDKFVGLLTWAVVTALILGASFIDKRPLLSDTPEKRMAEIIGSGFFAIMECYYLWRQLTNLRGMRVALLNYFDRDMSGVLRWMQVSSILIATMAVMVPLLIFFSSFWLAPFSVVMFAGIFYFVDSYCSFLLSTSFAKMQEAEQNEEAIEEYLAETEEGAVESLSEEAMLRVERAVERWIDRGGHLKSGMKLPAAAEDMQLPRYLLSAWLKQWGRRYNDWLTMLRIEEAKHVLEKHPDWNNEAVALHCGFTDRSYFQKKFKERTGYSPAEYLSLKEK